MSCLRCTSICLGYDGTKKEIIELFKKIDPNCQILENAERATDLTFWLAPQPLNYITIVLNHPFSQKFLDFVLNNIQNNLSPFLGFTLSSMEYQLNVPDFSNQFTNEGQEEDFLYDFRLDVQNFFGKSKPRLQRAF